MASSVIELDAVRKDFGGVRAVDAVTLEVARGEIFGLIGPNGAGKSTLFKLMLGLIAPSAGAIRIDGERVDGAGFRDVRRRVGYLPENVVLWDNLSGLETLRFFAALKRADARGCADALARVGLAEAAERRVRGYSKGMRQRLGFAQALLGEPALLFLDEPTSGLDPQSRRDFYAALRALRERGVTVVLTSHVLAEMQERVDRLAIMRQGALAAIGSVAALRQGIGLALRAEITPGDGAAQALADTLARCGFQTMQSDGRLRVDCARERKMALLAALAPLIEQVRDIELREPSLEDVFAGYTAQDDSPPGARG